MNTAKYLFFFLSLHCINSVAQISRPFAAVMTEDETPADTSGTKGLEKDAGDLIFTDDFSDPGNWNLVDLAGEGAEWEITDTEPPEILD